MFEYNKTTKMYSSTADRAEAARFLSYFAGFYEADGALSIYLPTSGQCQGKVTIEQKNVRILEVFYDNLGGNLYKKPKQAIFEWYTAGHQGKALLQLILPYMRISWEIERAGRYIEFFSSVDKEECRHMIEIDRELTRLHRERLSEEAKII